MDQKGIALLLTLVLLGTIIATALGVAVLTASQTGITRLVDDSTLAVFAADAGAEKMFYACSGKITYASPASFTNNDIGNGAGYTVTMSPSVPATCNDTLVESVGKKNTAQRSFEAIY